MRLVLKLFLVLLIVAIAILGWGVISVRTWYRGYPSTGVFVEIPPGTSRHAIARKLQEAGVVRRWYIFEAYSLWNTHYPLEAGEYLFMDGTSPEGAFWKIAMGHVYVRTIIVPEGWTSFQIAAELERQGQCSQGDFLAAVRDTSLVRDFAPHAQSLEGYLFPATYQFSRQQSAHDIAAAMVRRFRGDWTKLMTAGKTDSNVERVVTIASLVERETPLAQERPLVASVFYNRLDKGLPLQCDPTVQYSLEMAGRSSTSLTGADLHFDSPYNTYRYAGLPPGPIANPGNASLRAALYPAHSNYLYFVANARGGHFFSTTLAEQNRNVTVYHRRLAGQPDGLTPSRRTRHRRQTG